MLSTAADALQIAQAAPWLAVVVVCLVVVFWVKRQARRDLEALEKRVRESNTAQGGRLGDLEQDRALERVRRLQLEDELLRRGWDLPCWPPDGDRPRPLPYPDPETLEADYLPPWEHDRRPAPPIPPLPESVTRHRRP